MSHVEANVVVVVLVVLVVVVVVVVLVVVVVVVLVVVVGRQQHVSSASPPVQYMSPSASCVSPLLVHCAWFCLQVPLKYSWETQ